MAIKSPILAALALGLTIASGMTSGALAQASLEQSGLVGKPEGITMITDPAKWPKIFRGADARGAGEAGQAAAGRAARSGRTAGVASR